MGKAIRTVKIPMTDEEWKRFCIFADRHAYFKGAFIARLIKEHMRQEEAKQYDMVQL